MKNHSLLLTLSASVLVLFGFGCNPTASIEQKVSEKIVEGMVEQASDGKMKVDVNGQKVSFTDNVTGDSMAFGENLKIPDTFPKDIPIYAGTSVIAVVSANQDAPTSSLSLSSKDSVTTIVSWYEAKMKDDTWKQVSSFSANGIEIRSYKKGNVTLAITVSPKNDGSDATLINLVHQVQK